MLSGSWCARCYCHVIDRSIIYFGQYTRFWFSSHMPLKAYADVSGDDKGLIFDLNLNLHPYFVYASSEGRDKSAHMRRFASTFAAH